MKQQWNITLLGTLKAKQGERTITRFRTQKTASLLAYLAYHRHKSHPRELLIELLWPEAEPESGRHNLSLALSSLRNQLEPPGVVSGSVIVADRWAVELNPESFSTDVATFEQILRTSAQTRDDTPKMEALRRAVDTYTGQLLPGFYEDWVLTEQTRLSERYFQALLQLTSLLEKESDLATAIEYARKAVEVDPLREETHGELIRLLATAGQATVALRQYRELERLLDQEYGEPPSPKLRQLIRHIEQMEVKQPPMLEASTPVRLATHKVQSGSTPTQPQGTVTFLLTDIEGSTSHWEHHGDGFKATLNLHHAILRKEFRRHGGYEFKETGDGFLVAFSNAGDALACAVACQRDLAAQTWSNQEVPLKVRMALHSGDAEAEDGDYHGLTLHCASRILGAGSGAQTLCSESTTSLLRRDLEMEISLKDLGVYRLRDVELPERIFQVEYAGMEQREFPTLRADRAFTGSLPLQFTRFFGREAEIALLRQMLAPQERLSRLVTLTGTGGTGKTRLALEAAKHLAEQYAGAVWFVELADLEEASLLPDTLLEAMHLSPTGEEQPLEQIGKVLSANPSLLILDNMEQVVNGGAEFVQVLLERVPSLTCLVTSRQVLGIAGEQEFVVPPLPTPGDEGSSPALLGVYESVRLFVDRAQAVKPDFQVTNSNAPAVAELCNRLEGMPLAIELAAARAQVMTPSQMLAQLGNRFDLLVSRKRGVAERQRTLRAAIDWSYRLLSPELQQFFTRLCVFRGGWTVEAAEAVTGEALTLDMLAQLREGSLLQTEVGVSEMRFRMLESIRDFACEQLQSEERAKTEEAHANYYLRFAEQAEQGLRSGQQSEWLERLEEAHENLRVALGWASQAEREECHLRLVSALWYFWSIRGFLNEGRRRMREALERVPSSHPHFGKSELRAEALSGAGALALDQSDMVQGVALLAESVALWRELGGNTGLAKALNLYGNAMLEKGELTKALALYEEALALYRALDNRRGASILLNNLGVLAQDEGDLDRASRLLSESIRYKRGLGNRYGLANSLDSLGNVEAARGNGAQARTLYDEALSIRREIGHQHGVAISLNNLGNLALRGHDTETARLHYFESLPILKELEEREGVVECLFGLAGVAIAIGSYEVGAQLYGAIHALCVQEGIALTKEQVESEKYGREKGEVGLGESGYEKAQSQGKYWGWEEIISFALESLKK